MLHKNYEFRHHQRMVHIKRRETLMRNCYGGWIPEQLGHLDKYHVGCGCGLCKPTKRFHYPSEKQMREEEKANKELKDWFED